MAHAGGRPKGSRNKASVAREQAVAESGQTPLDFLLSVMRNESFDMNLRIDAGKSVAPYVHPKLATIEVGNKPGEKFQVTLASGDAGVL